MPAGQAARIPQLEIVGREPVALVGLSTLEGRWSTVGAGGHRRAAERAQPVEGGLLAPSCIRILGLADTLAREMDELLSLLDQFCTALERCRVNGARRR